MPAPNSTISEKSEIIPQTFYMVGDKFNLFGTLKGAETVTFYAFDGKELYKEKLAKNARTESLRRKLDPSALKPQPISYQAHYFRAPQIRLPLIKKPINALVAPVPGWFVVFYDKNGQKIESFRLNKRIRL